MEGKNSIARVAAYFMRYRFLFVLNMFLALASTAFEISIPKIIQFVIDEIIMVNQIRWLWLGLAAIVTAYFMRDALNYLRIRLNNVIEQRVLIDLRAALHRKLMHLPVGFFDERKTGDISSRVTEDVLNVEGAILDGTEQGLTSVFTLLGIAAFLFITNPVLATFAMLPIPLLLLMAKQHYKISRRNWKRVRRSAGDMHALLVEDISGHRLISSFALQERERSRFLNKAEDLKNKTLTAMYRWAYYSSTTRFISSLSLVAVLGIGGYQYVQGSLTIGELAMFLLYSGRILEPISRLNGLNNLLSAAKPSGDRVFEILDHEIKIENPPKAVPFPSSPISVRFKDVSFAYETRPAIISNFNLELPEGKVTALVGRTGAGKSTVANLLLRYYDVGEGAVLINRLDVRKIDLTSLRNSIGLVAQEPFLFDGTIRDNLLLAKESASEEDLWQVLRGAHVHGFVTSLPDRLDTMIGERGIRLSLGEKQRIAIARALLKNPPLVILDEATSSVDSATESKIQEALENLTSNRTVLIIAHRLSTVRKADNIVVLGSGRVVETGTHENLMRQRGEYYNFWRIQYDMVEEQPPAMSL